jgi:hypothetical protein
MSDAKHTSSRFVDSVIDFMWGDQPGHIASLKLVLKLAATVLIALAVHQAFARASLSIDPDKEGAALVEAFGNANAVLKRIHPVPDVKVGEASAEYLSLCFDAKPAVKSGGCFEPQYDKNQTYAAGYQILAHAGGKSMIVAKGTIYEVVPELGWISTAHIRESIDTLLRKVELVAFNGTDKPITEVKLCNGTRTLEVSPNCNETKRIGEALGASRSGIFTATNVAIVDPNLQTLVDRVRLRSLFIGPIQLGTLCIFLFAALETFGLWLRWVAPADKLFANLNTRKNPSRSLWRRAISSARSLRTSTSTSKEGETAVSAEQPTGAKPANSAVELPAVGNTDNTGRPPFAGRSLLIPRPLPEALDQVLASRIRSPGDQLYLVDLKAAADVPFSPPATQEEFVSVHSSYRDYLQEDAIARQDFLETLGDTMLKLAFLGTVYGISSALFSARGLDTADPILRLATKADMYSGIGVGFGATLLGILLSIIAAQLRTVLASAWAGKIGLAYQLILDFGVDRLREEAKKLNTSDVQRIHPYVPPPDRDLNSIERFGLFALLVILGVIAYVRWDDLEAVVVWLTGAIVGQ